MVVYAKGDIFLHWNHLVYFEGLGSYRAGPADSDPLGVTKCFEASRTCSARSLILCFAFVD